MAITILNMFGVSSTPAVTGTPGTYIVGPPGSGFGKQRGLYILQSGTPGTNGTYRWLEDVQYTAGAPTTYAAGHI